MTRIAAVAIGAAAITGTAPGARLQPDDLVYLGAFRLPAGASDLQSWAYGGTALTWLPEGDPGGGADGYPGSLVGIGHAWYQLASEASIPPPVISPDHDVTALDRAVTLQPFADVTGGLRAVAGIDPDYLHVGGLALVTARPGQPADAVYWTVHDWYNVSGTDHLGLGRSRPLLSDPQPAGVWHIGEAGLPGDVFHSLKTAGYLLVAPAAWADTHVAGRALLSGRHREAGAFGASQGPTLYASAPWLEADPVHGDEIGATALVYYPEGGGFFPDYRACDHWNGAAWIEAGAASAVLIAGRKSLGETRYGAPAPDDCEQSQGYHCDPYRSELLLYDPAELAEVAAGSRLPWQVVPYARFLPETFFWPTCHDELGGVAYDTAHRLLYVVQLAAATDGEPLVHVFGVAAPLFADDFESGDTSAWSTAVSTPAPAPPSPSPSLPN